MRLFFNLYSITEAIVYFSNNENNNSIALQPFECQIPPTDLWPHIHIW